MWVPEISNRRPLYRAIAEAIREAIDAGVLVSGGRLPPQRHLARKLRVNLSTVTKAYAFARETGLVDGEVGRGTFVRYSPRLGAVPWPRSPPNLIDLSSNFPVLAAGEIELAAAVRSITGEGGARKLFGYLPNAALPRHLEAGAKWLADLGAPARPDRILLTSGAIHAVFVCLLALGRSGQTIIVEELTSPSLIGACNMLGLRIVGAPMDANGVRPEELERLLATTEAKLVHLTPNLQNPSLAIIDGKRRKQIARVLQRHGAILIEDDAYGPLLPNREQPFAALIPNSVCYVSSLSKSVAPGLRVGYVLAPKALCDRLRSALQVTTWMTSPITAGIAARWITDGTAGVLIGRQRQTTLERQRLARTLLAEHAIIGNEHALHVWLSLPAPWRSTEFAEYARSRGVAVLPSENMAAEAGYRPQFVRVSLGAVSDLEDLTQGVRILRTIIVGTCCIA